MWRSWQQEWRTGEGRGAEEVAAWAAPQAHLPARPVWRAGNRNWLPGRASRRLPLNDASGAWARLQQVAVCMAGLVETLHPAGMIGGR